MGVRIKADSIENDGLSYPRQTIEDEASRSFARRDAIKRDRPTPREYGDEIRVVKMHIDVNLGMRTRFAISSIPALLLFQNGVECERILGAASRTA